MNRLLHRIEKVLHDFSLSEDERPLVTAVSGGSDSISLLHIISKLLPERKLFAVYVDHGLRPNETSAEMSLVRRQAEICQARFISISVDVPALQKNSHCSLEDAARILRYQALERVRESEDAALIALGHTADDQAEELLLRLIRGSGSTGLSGMNMRNGYLFRPLLHETKSQLISFLKEQNIPFCTDSSNHDTRFLRNRIRMELLPQLEERYNPAMRQTLLQTASILSAEDTLLSAMTTEAYEQSVSVSSHGIALSLTEFQGQPLAIQRRIIDTICWKLDSQPSYNKIQNLLKLCDQDKGHEIHLSNGLRATRERKVILFEHPGTCHKGYRGPAVVPVSFAPVVIEGPGTYKVPAIHKQLTIMIVPHSGNLAHTHGTLMLDAQSFSFPLLLRLPEAGERFYPLGAPGSKKVLRFLSDRKISAKKKNAQPVLLSGDTIVAIPGLQIGHPFRITSKTSHKVELYWSPF